MTDWLAKALKKQGLVNPGESVLAPQNEVVNQWELLETACDATKRATFDVYWLSDQPCRDRGDKAKSNAAIHCSKEPKYNPAHGPLKSHCILYARNRACDDDIPRLTALA